MDLAKIKEILETESSVFKEAVQSAIDQAVDRRVQAKVQIAESLGLNQTDEMSEQDFFAILDQYAQISNHLDAVLEQAGFSVEVRSAWLNKKDSPRPKFRRAIVQMLLEVVIDHYADNPLFHDMHNVLESWQLDESIESRTPINRETLLKKQLIACAGYDSLSTRTKNALFKDGVKTVARLAWCSEAEALRIPLFGHKSLNETKAFLAELGLTFGCVSEEELERATT